MIDKKVYNERLTRILRLIEKGKLQSPRDLMKEFDCSEKTVRNMINVLREKGYVIRYSRSRQRYYLEE